MPRRRVVAPRQHLATDKRSRAKTPRTVHVSVGIGSAQAAPLTCGSVVTSSTTLTADIGPCADNGIVVGADNITLDLGGHHVFGTPQPGDGAGVLVQGRHQVTVVDGTVTDFDAGVVMSGG